MCSISAIGHGHEAPVLLPRRVVDVADELDLPVEVLHVERPRSDAGALHHPVGRLVHELAHGLADRRGGRPQILGFAVARRARTAFRSRAGCAGMSGRRPVEALDQQSAVVVGGEVHRPARHVHAARARATGRRRRTARWRARGRPRTRRSRRSRPGRSWNSLCARLTMAAMRPTTRPSTTRRQTPRPRRARRTGSSCGRTGRGRRPGAAEPSVGDSRCSR